MDGFERGVSLRVIERGDVPVGAVALPAYALVAALLNHNIWYCRDL